MLSYVGSLSRPVERRASMQLKLAFLENETAEQAPRQDQWERIDPNARDGATTILSRLIARMLQSTPTRETRDE